MNPEIDLNAYFRMDKTVGGVITPELLEEQASYWLSRPVEERYYAIEFLRGQWIEMNNLPSRMDKSFFEYRK